MIQIDVSRDFRGVLTGKPTDPLSPPEEGRVHEALSANWIVGKLAVQDALDKHLGNNPRYSDLGRLADSLLTSLGLPGTKRIEVVVDDILQTSKGLKVVAVAPINPSHQQHIAIRDFIETYFASQTRRVVQAVVLEKFQQEEISERRQHAARESEIDEAFIGIKPKGWGRQSQRNHLWSEVKKQVIEHHLMEVARDKILARSPSGPVLTEAQVRARAEKLWNELDRRIKREETMEQLKTRLYKLALWGLAGASIGVLLVVGPNVLSTMISLMQLVPSGMLDRRFKYLKLDPLDQLKQMNSKDRLVRACLKAYWQSLSAPGLQNRAVIFDFRGESNRMDRFVAEPLKYALGQALKVRHGTSLIGWNDYFFDQKIDLAAQRMNFFNNAWNRDSSVGLLLGMGAGAIGLLPLR